LTIQINYRHAERKEKKKTQNGYPQAEKTLEEEQTQEEISLLGPVSVRNDYNTMSLWALYYNFIRVWFGF
jgi:hypothetical protein